MSSISPGSVPGALESPVFQREILALEEYSKGRISGNEILHRISEGNTPGPCQGRRDLLLSSRRSLRLLRIRSKECCGGTFFKANHLDLPRISARRTNDGKNFAKQNSLRRMRSICPVSAPGALKKLPLESGSFLTLEEY
jgi:hypothetical protein